jgi:hypothetical protein
MTDAEKLRAAARTLALAEEGVLAGHPEPSTLLAYHRRELSPEEAERLRDHLALCGECSRLLLQVESFPALSSQTALLTDRQQAAEWALLRDRIGFATSAPAPAPAPAPSRLLSRRFPLPWALAASLLLATTLGLGVWVLRLRDEVGALAGPQVHLAVADLTPEGSGPREGAEPAAVRLAADADRLLLILNLADWRPFAGYHLRVTGPAGQAVWEGDLARSAHGNFLLTLPRALLPAGSYRLRLNGRTSAGKEQPLAEYRLQIAGPP